VLITRRSARCRTCGRLEGPIETLPTWPVCRLESCSSDELLHTATQHVFRHDCGQIKARHRKFYRDKYRSQTPHAAASLLRFVLWTIAPSYTSNQVRWRAYHVELQASLTRWLSATDACSRGLIHCCITVKPFRKQVQYAL